MSSLLNKESFTRNVSVAALRVAASSVGLLRQKIQKSEILALPRVKSIIPDANDASKRLLLLAETIQEEDNLDQQSQQAMREYKAELVHHTVSIGFEHLTTHEVLKTLLPPHMDIPSSFETAGHIAHVNLRDEHAPYRALIGSVVLAKNPHIRTVVNKVGTIDSTFRFFKMEVIAGEDDTVVEVQEGGCHFKFDYAKVYWNSRLQAEHHRLVERFQEGQSILDMFCGVGPFALPAAKKGCVVYANDLNPESVSWLRVNARRNRAEASMHIYNLDARDFVRQVLGAGHVPDHLVMNLPASAHEFLDIFPILAREAILGEEVVERATVHCYIFCRTDEDPHDKMSAGLGYPIERDRTQVRRIRDVAPNKEMFCVSFRLPHCILPSGTERGEGDAKRPRIHGE